MHPTPLQDSLSTLKVAASSLERVQEVMREEEGRRACTVSDSREQAVRPCFLLVE